MQKELFINPFIYLAGTKALLIGIGITLLLSLTSYYSGTHYSSLLKVSFAKDMDFQYFLAEHILYLVIGGSTLLMMGLIFSKSKIRIEDVYGTLAIARTPLLILPAIRFIPVFASMAANSIYLDILFWIHLFVVGWAVVLMFNAYKVSCNVKGVTVYASFIASLVFSEILVTNIIKTIIP